MLEVVSRIGHTFVRRRDDEPCLGSVTRSFLFTRESLLFTAQIALCTLHELRVVRFAAVAIDRDVSQSDIDDIILMYDGWQLGRVNAIVEEQGCEILARRRLRQRD